MPGRGQAPTTGKNLEERVEQLAQRLGLQTLHQVRVGRRIWGAVRILDLIVRDACGKRLGIECKYQGQAGTAEEKIPTLIQDIAAWPIDGLVVFDGEGFSENMKAFLFSTGKAVLFEDLEIWLRLYFGLEIA